MVKIRLSRIGRKNLAHYRVVAVQAREKRDTNAIELLGHYSPFTKELVLNEERIKYWLSVGAQPTERVKNWLVEKKLIKAPEFKKVYSKKPGKQNNERKAKAEKAAEVTTESK